MKKFRFGVSVIMVSGLFSAVALAGTCEENCAAELIEGVTRCISAKSDADNLCEETYDSKIAAAQAACAAEQYRCTNTYIEEEEKLLDCEGFTNLEMKYACMRVKARKTEELQADLEICYDKAENAKITERYEAGLAWLTCIGDANAAYDACMAGIPSIESCLDNCGE